MASEKKILSFTVNGVGSFINNSAKSIQVPVEETTDLTSIIPVIEVPLLSNIQPQSGDVIDLTSTVIYTVTSDDLTTQEYLVSAVVMPNHNSALTIFKLILNRLTFLEDIQQNRELVSQFIIESMYNINDCLHIDDINIGNEYYYTFPMKSLIADIVSLAIIKRLALSNVAGNNQTGQSNPNVPPSQKFLSGAKAGSVDVTWEQFSISDKAFLALDTPTFIEELKASIRAKGMKFGCMLEITDELLSMILKRKPNLGINVSGQVNRDFTKGFKR